MATVRNARDVILQAAATRTTNTANAAVLLTASTNVFHINAAGANDPASITFTYNLVELDGPATFAVTGGTLTTSGNVATLTYANMPGSTASVTASVTVNGVTFASNPCFVTKVLDGLTGSTGARGAGQYFATGSAWSDATADAATPGATNIAGDVVTISNGTTFVGVRGWSGSAWVAVAPTYDGGAIFPGTVTVNQINANSLVLRDASGNPLVGLGVPLAAGLEAPGTFSPPSKGGAINDDPAIEYSAYWSVPTGIAISTGAGTGSVGDKFFNAPSYNGTERVVISTRSHAIDPNRVYSLTANLFTNTGNNRSMYLLVNFYDAAGAAIPYTASTPQWGGGYSGYTFAGVPPSPGSWTRCGANFGPGTGRSIPATAKTCKIGVWFQYTGSGSSSVQQGAQDIRLVDVHDAVAAQAAADAANSAINDTTTGLAAKLSRTSASSLAATVTVTTGGSILSGTPTNGTYQSPSGFYGVQGGVVKFSVPISGDPTFAGQLSAAYGSFGAVTIAAGGSLAIGQTAYNTGTGLYFGFVGVVPKFSAGVGGGAGITFDGTYVTLTDAIVVRTTPFAVNNVTDATYTYPHSTSQRSLGSYTASSVGNSGTVTYSWFITNSVVPGTTCSFVGTSSGASVSIQGSCNLVANVDYYVTVTATDSSGAAAKSETFNINVDFT